MDHREEDGDGHMVKGRLCPLMSDCANKTPLSCQDNTWLSKTSFGHEL